MSREHQHYACRHVCGCALEGELLCVACAFADPLLDDAARETIWAARWPDHHPHPVDGPQLPDQHRKGET